MALKLSKQRGEFFGKDDPRNTFSVFADFGEVKQRITDYTGDVSGLPSFQGGTTGGDVTLAQAQKRMADEERYRQELAQAQKQTREQQVGTVQALQEGRLGRAIRPDEVSMLRKKGISEAQLGGVQASMTPEQAFRERTGRFPTREEMIGLGIKVPTTTAPIGEGVAGLTPSEALERLKKEQKNLSDFGTAIPTPEQIAAGPVKQKEPTTTISKKTLEPTPEIDFKTPTEPSTATGVFLTPEQEKQQKESDEAIKLSNKLAKEGAAQAAAEAKEGVTKKTAMVTDLEAEFEAVNNEAKAITFELEKRSERQGITQTIAGRQERALLRENTLKALGISTRLSAARGLLKSAKARAKEAVEREFNPIKDEYNARIRNLDILSKSPKATLEEKKQAADMKANQEAQKKKVDEIAAIKLFNKKLVIEVISQNPDFNDQDLLDSIEAAPTEAAGMKLAAPYLQKEVEGETTDIKNYQFYAQQVEDPISFDSWLSREANRKASASSAGISQQTQGLVSTILDNPTLFSQLTSTEKAKVAPALDKLGFTAFGKPLSDTAIKAITQSETALESVKDLKKVVKENEKFIGPITGLAKLNPFSEARKVQADIDRVKQRVGKALEGGVLRKEDEEKYKKILAQITDTPETALYKINQIIIDIEREITTYKNNQMLSGRNVPTAPTTESDPLGIRK